MLDMLGQAEYGLYSLAHSAVAYLSLLSFGFGSTIIRYIAKYNAEGNKEAEEILREAARNVEKATEERMNHIQAFNKAFGPYMTSYVGDKAVDEYNKIIRRMRDAFGRHGFWLF